MEYTQSDQKYLELAKREMQIKRHTVNRDVAGLVNRFQAEIARLEAEIQKLEGKGRRAKS
jgi:hypothetical protein